MSDDTYLYNMVLPTFIFDQVKATAERKQVSVTEVIRKYIELGLLVEGRPGAELILREGDKETRIVIL